MRCAALYPAGGKTTWEDHRLVSGWNCTAKSVCSEMQLTKERFHKTDGRQYYHFMQSFEKQDDLSPQEVHAMGLELAQREFPNFEVLVATHVDTGHLHNHLVVNNVSFQDGKKIHQSAADLQAHRIANHEICAAHHLEILPPPQKQVKQKRMSAREYRSAAKGESWKFRLINAIDQCMRCAASKEEFISLMESEGYQVRWTDSRKNIPYTTPTGMKGRDDRLHDRRYTKEVMEYEFRIRAALTHGGIEAEECSADYDTAKLSRQGGVAGAAPSAGRAGAAHSGTHSPSAGGFQPEGAVPHPGADGGAGAGCGRDTGTAATGWEEERDFYFSAQSGNGNVGHSMAGSDFAGNDGGYGSLADDLVRLGRSLERDQAADSVRDATTMHQHTDRKVLLREWELKIAMGHREDDHEDELTWKQAM
ncbi:relaxase/mobilization nuclease domain-containing protein [Dysosmobacter sp.]|uniref:relaxase/mobilization nuclease domain-containing protein n=1 Tax=Dysosmobacter sp. TaxID=2591382 RepID=UPI003A8F2FA7